MHTSSISGRAPLAARALAAGALLSLTLPSPAAVASEGMYLMDRLPVSRLKRSGLKIPTAELQRLAQAIVKVGRGGTGSFVSGKGLMVTNHHVAYGCLVRLNARKQHQGIMDRGHVAKTAAEEIPCPAYFLRVLVKMQDVTSRVLAGIPAPTRRNYKKRHEQLRLRRESLRKACEAGGRHVCEVQAKNGGTSYYMSTYRRVRDVRLVYAPPKSLGKYGGDVDNWMFPRHTADFTYLRAYVSPKGAGSAYAKENVPLQTPVHLKVSPYGVKKGSLVMVMGFPGRTMRHRTSHSVRFYVRDHLGATIDMLGQVLTVLNKRRAASKDARRKYMGLESGLQNGVKYYGMSKKGFEKWKALDRKLQWEKALFSGKGGEVQGRAVPKLGKKGARQARKLHAEMGKLYTHYRKYHRRLQVMGRITSWVIPSMRVSHDIVKWSIEKGKKDELRKNARYKDKNVFSFMGASARLEKEMELQTEKALLLFFLRQGEKLPRAQRPRAIARLEARAKRAVAKLRRQAKKGKKDYAKLYQEAYGAAPSKDALQTAVDVLYGGTQLLARGADAEEVKRAVALRKKLFGMSKKEIAKNADPLLAFARDLEKEMRELREGPMTLVDQYLVGVLRPRWVKQFKQASYPDANFTLRLTYGSVRDYHETATGKDHRYMTDLAGLMKKDKGKYPFTVPAYLKAAFPGRLKSRFVDRRIKDVPANFTSTLDTTGGNSGSPVLDDRGRLVGLLFDGTPESILSDWQYLHAEQRSICMDIRMAHYLATVRGAQRVLDELGVKYNKRRAKAKKSK